MAYQPITWAFEEVVTSTKMNQFVENLEQARKQHKASAQPLGLEAGVLWLDDSSTPWRWRMFDGTDQIVVGRIDAANDLFFLDDGSGIYLARPDAVAGPLWRLRRESSAPAAGHEIGKILFEGENDSSNVVTYADVRAQIQGVAPGAEKANIKIFSKIAGVDVEQIAFEDGARIGTGAAFPGPGILNAENGLQVGGISVLIDQAGNVRQSSLATSQGSVSTGGTGSNIGLPGGQYGFYPQIRTTGNGTHQISLNTGNGSYSTQIHIISNSGTTYAQQRYITSSPPFDMGDGPVHGFIFLLVENGNVISSYAADVPPWAYNGPTCIRADAVDPETKMPCKMVAKSAALLMDFRKGVIGLAEMREKMRSPEYEGFDMVPIDQAMKNADMPLIPHPFAPEPGQSVLLLDPMDELVGDLIAIQNAGEEGLLEAIMDGKIKPKTEPLPRKGPAGVTQVGIE